MNDITSTITKPLAVLGENGSGYTKEANFVSWNGNDAKLDIKVIVCLVQSNLITHIYSLRPATAAHKKCEALKIQIRAAINRRTLKQVLQADISG